MAEKSIRQRLENLKRRAKQRQKKMPFAKPSAATVIENQNATDLMPYVYKSIGEVK
ncbi:MAG: hypothetical protein II939_06675 [Bacteroidales bacterium]|nr:hypothetical protein [Bacteroidales bacterium]